MNASFQDHFSAAADAYAARRPRYPAALARFLADLAPSRARAWDAGCGSGQLSTLLGDYFEQVIATDASAAQIGNAQAHPRVEYRQSQAEASGLAPGSVDLATAAQAAHWFDHDAYHAEVRRVTRDGGIVALVSYGLVSVGDDIDPLLRRFHDEDLAVWWPAARRHVVAGYATLPFPFEPLPAPSFAMAVEWSLAELLGYIGTWSAVQALRRDHGEAGIETFSTEVARLWGAPGLRRTVQWPLVVRAGRVQTARHVHEEEG
jgi:SAM-dependent methyltransferase